MMTNSSFRAPSLDYHIGDEAYANASTHDLKYILNSGQISDWESMEKYWHQSIHNYLSVDPANHRFILTEPPSNTPENREMMAEIMFETFGVKGLFIGV
jgi:actin-related protein 3